MRLGTPGERRTLRRHLVAVFAYESPDKKYRPRDADAWLHCRLRVDGDAVIVSKVCMTQE